MAGTGIERIGVERKAQVAATLGEAFRDDPLLRIVAPDDRRRGAITEWLLGVPLSYGLRWGEVWGNEDVSAVSIWLPPGTEMTALRLLRVGAARLPLKIGLSATRRFVGGLSAVERFHKAVEGPHWYLMLLGTRTARQGQGLGSTLLACGTDQADGAGLPCYLETATDENVAFYRKRGFEVTGETTFQSYMLRAMVRQPR